MSNTPHHNDAEHLRSPPQSNRAKRALSYSLGLIGVGLVLGLVISGSAATIVQQTNDTEFCVQCHVYSTFYAEFKETADFSFESGFQAKCSDCHLPGDAWWNTLAGKTASGLTGLAAYTIGGVNTPEEFAAIRAELAEEVVQRFRAEDSAKCRQCHAAEVWDLDEQMASAKAAHESALPGGATCIDCHQGIAHSLPESPQVAAIHAEPARNTERDGAAPGQSEAPVEELTQATDATDGAQLFRRCSSCHGASAPGPAELATLDLQSFNAEVARHFPVGGILQSLSEQDIQAIHAYLQGQ